MSQIIAVDIGGTNIRTAYFSRPEPPPDSQSKVPTNANEGPDAVLSRLFEAIESEIPSNAENLMISIGAPGPLDPFEGVILEATALGLNTCWVGGFYRRDGVLKQVNLEGAERILGITPIGYSKDETDRVGVSSK